MLAGYRQSSRRDDRFMKQGIKIPPGSLRGPGCQETTYFYHSSNRARHNGLILRQNESLS